MKMVTENSEKYISKATKKIKDLNEISNKCPNGCIYTKGVFDILHFGHISLLYFMSKLKTKYKLPIVVGVTCDEIVKKRKGSNRPINPDLTRAKQIALFAQVDYVFIRKEDSSEKTIAILNPLFYIKGMDTTVIGDDIISNNPELALMSENSTFIVFNDDNEMSTSLLISKIRAADSSVD